MLAITSAKVTAAPSRSGWAQVHEFVPDDPEQLRIRGRLIVVISTKKAGEGIDTIASGREIIGRLHEEYFGAKEGKPFDALRDAAKKVVNEFVQSLGDVEIAASAFVEGVIYSVASGGAKVLICRDGALATILESSGEVITASGYPKDGDVILLATKTFFQKVSIETVKTALTTRSPEAAAETISPVVHGGVEDGNLGAVILKFETQKPNPTVSQNAIPPILPKDNPVNLLKQKASSLLNKFKNRIPQRSIYIKSAMGDEVTSQSKKMTFSVGVILLVILIVSIGFGIRQKSVNDMKKKYQGILSAAQAEVDQAIGLASVSPDKSRELFMDSEQKLKQILALKVTDPKVADLQKKIEESKGAILGEYDGTPTLYLDLSLLSSGFTGDAVSASGGQIYILDKSGKRVVSVAIDTKKSKVVAGPSVIDNATDLASYQDKAFILTGDGIYQVALVKTKVIDKTWVGDALISAFAGNIYVLDKSGNAIYRYSGQTGDTFGTQQNWLSASTKANFSGATAWGMDGAIYVLYPNSKILRYSLGSPQNFSLSGIIPEIGSVDAIYADSDNQYIYLLDKAGKRVVVIDKKGKYKAQYTDDQIAGAKSLVVSESQKQIILLTGDKLLSIEIKHL
jgi:nitrate reductase NapAB chaperone NapD